MSSLLELLKQKQQDMAASRKGRTVKIPDGASRWRLMGHWKGEEKFPWHDFGQHFIKDASGKVAAVYVCAQKTHGKPCAVCDAVAQGIKSAVDDETMKLLTEAKSGAGRVLFNAVLLNDSGEQKVEILEMPGTAFEQLIVAATEWEEAGESIFGMKGKDVIFNRSGKGLGTTYTVTVAAKSKAMQASLDKKLHDLDDYVSAETSDAQMRALNSVRAISGLLPAPAASGMRGVALLESDDPYEAAPRPAARAVAKVEEFEDVPDTSAPAVKPAAVKAATKPAAVASTSTGDEDLDALLAGLD